MTVQMKPKMSKNQKIGASEGPRVEQPKVRRIRGSEGRKNKSSAHPRVEKPRVRRIRGSKHQKFGASEGPRDYFGILLGSFWDHFGIILGSFWDHFGVTLGSFWGHFGIILGPPLSAALLRRSPPPSLPPQAEDVRNTFVFVLFPVASAWA